MSPTKAFVGHYIVLIIPLAKKTPAIKQQRRMIDGSCKIKRYLRGVENSQKDYDES
jgi:hypothetical protein